MIKEVCVENFTHIPIAIEKGAHRIELCDCLSVGGTTVSYSVASHSLAYCKINNVKIMAIIRPRGGHFVYSDEEITIMLEDIIHFKELGMHGVVFGCLNNEGWIDENSMQKLLHAAHGMDTTFHMAFDHIQPTRRLEAIDWLASKGMKRILTHGGPLHTKIEQNISIFKEYLTHASDRIIIMPGGGITNKNLPMLSQALAIREVHGTRILGSLIAEEN